MDIGLISCKIILFIVLLILLIISYNISFNINSTLIINQKCGDNVIEMDTLRNKALYFKKIPFVVFIIILLIIIILCTIMIIYNKNKSVLIYCIIAVVALINIYVNAIPYNFLKERYYKDYSNIFDTIVCEIIYVFTEINDLKFDGTIRTIFPPNVLDEIVFRWKSFQNENYKEFNTHTEVIYTDNAFIDELDDLLMNIKYSCQAIENDGIDMTEDVIKSIRDTNKSVRLFISLLSPEKRELSFIHEAYKKWGKKNSKRLGNKYKKSFTHLPRLKEHNNFDLLIKSKTDTFLYISWILLIITVGLFKSVNV